ncbi:Hypothetical protein PBC10988_31130 [Planctomycetales bacterium 10988]|nr:Hypothetical protein PBC10988_31130 [Planctomycetales bacterium 10988]
MNYQEFKLLVPIWDISEEVGDDEEEIDSKEIQSLFRLLSIVPPPQSLSDLYHSFYDESAAKYQGDPTPRMNRGDFILFQNAVDENVFLAIDMFNEPTDQMATIHLFVSVPLALADQAGKLLKTIRAEAEISSALLEGNLGIREELALENFPRLVPSLDRKVPQHVQVYRYGKIIYQSADNGT